MNPAFRPSILVLLLAAGCDGGKSRAIGLPCESGTHDDGEGCVPDGADTADSGETADSGDTATADTADTAETGDTAETTETADTTDTADTADTPTEAPTVDLSTAPGEIQGTRPREYFGWAVTAGDFDGDGRDDLVTSSPYDRSWGGLWAFSAPGPELLTDADAIAWASGTTDTYLGLDLEAADVDGDGLDDLLVGAPGWEHAGGFGMVLRGPLSGELTRADAYASWTSEPGWAEFGDDVAAGDLDGDGLPDVAVSAPMASETGGLTHGVVYVFGGAGMAGGAGVEGDAAAADARWWGEDTENLAMAVEIAPDLDGDGLDDLLVGGLWPGHWHESAVYLAPAGTGDNAHLDTDALAVIHDAGEVAAGTVARSIRGLGDTDGDGYGDLAVGAPQSFDAGGELQLFSGPLVGDLGKGAARARLAGNGTGQWLGVSLSTAGDTDGDGVVDLLVGAYLDDAAAKDAGAAWLVSGDVRGSLPIAEAATVVFQGHDAGDHAAYGALGDFDGDGRFDVAVGAPGREHADRDEGSVYLFFAATGF